MREIPDPEVVGCFFADAFDPPLSGMEIAWDFEAPLLGDRVWHLPGGVRLQGPAPSRFGITVVRNGDDAYQLRMLWNGLCLSWERLTRVQIMASSLAPLLGALGTDLWRLLMQPVVSVPTPALVA